MPDTSFLHWPFFEDRHRAYEKRLEAWAGANLQSVDHHDVDAACRKLVADLGEGGFLQHTAPGDGICIADNGIDDNAHDVVIRYLRLRRGNTDIFNRHGVHYGSPIGNIILDHISASWGQDQNIDTYRHMYQPTNGGPALKLPAVNVTIQWTITSEALNTYNHAFGGDWGGRNSGFHHNLFACNTGRNPSVAMTYDFNFVNNVLFNWRHRSVDGGGKVPAHTQWRPR